MRRRYKQYVEQLDKEELDAIFDKIDDYTQTKEWLKKVKYLRDKHKVCQVCGFPYYGLRIRHINFSRITREKEEDLIAVCQFCDVKIFDTKDDKYYEYRQRMEKERQKGNSPRMKLIDIKRKS